MIDGWLFPGDRSVHSFTPWGSKFIVNLISRAFQLDRLAPVLPLLAIRIGGTSQQFLGAQTSTSFGDGPKTRVTR
jgi:hypothetical protein